LQNKTILDKGLNYSSAFLMMRCIFIVIASNINNVVYLLII